MVYARSVHRPPALPVVRRTPHNARSSQPRRNVTDDRGQHRSSESSDSSTVVGAVTQTAIPLARNASRSTARFSSAFASTTSGASSRCVRDRDSWYREHASRRGPRDACTSRSHQRSARVRGRDRLGQRRHDAHYTRHRDGIATTVPEVVASACCSAPSVHLSFARTLPTTTLPDLHRSARRLCACRQEFLERLGHARTAAESLLHKDFRHLPTALRLTRLNLRTFRVLYVGTKCCHHHDDEESTVVFLSRTKEAECQPRRQPQGRRQPKRLLPPRRLSRRRPAPRRRRPRARSAQRRRQ